MTEELIAGRYRLEGLLGHGGMARVHRAWDTTLDRPVAVKLLRTDVGLDPTARERFLREARLAASLSHDHTVPVYDAGFDGDVPWLVMELVPGPSLRARLDEGPLALDEALTLAGEILSGLDAAHQRGIVHRDVKPGNVLLSPGGAKLADFGIAKSVAAAMADLTGNFEVLGTPKYTAPDDTRGTASPRQDVYAVGVLLYEMLAGAAPFTGHDPTAVALAHRQQPVPPLAERRGDVPPAINAVIERALAKDPDDRYADAGEMAAALHAAAQATTALPEVPDALGATQALAAPGPAAAIHPDPEPSPPRASRPQPVRGPRRRTAAAPPPERRRRRPAARTGRGNGIVTAVVVLLLAAAATLLWLDRSDSTRAPAGTNTPTATPAPPASTAPPDATAAPAPPPAPSTPRHTSTPAPTPTPTRARAPEPTPTRTRTPAPATATPTAASTVIPSPGPTATAPAAPSRPSTSAT